MTLFDKFILKDKTFLVICSNPLDADSISSGLMIKKYLESLGKTVKIMFPRPVRNDERNLYSFLPYFSEIEDGDTRNILKKKNFDILVLLDGADLIQFYNTSETEDDGPNLSIYDKRIHIDHHLKKPDGLGTFTIHSTQISSTAELILTEIIPEDFIDKNIATLGYAGLCGDTGNFEFNFYASTLKLAGKLIEKGADYETILDKLVTSKNRTYFQMLKFALNNLEYIDEGKLMCIYLPFAKLSETNLSEGDYSALKWAFFNGIGGLDPDYPISVMILEKEPGKIKVSAIGSSAHNKINLPKFFQELGSNGGGHFNVSGISLEGDIAEFKKTMISKLKSKL